MKISYELRIKNLEFKIKNLVHSLKRKGVFEWEFQNGDTHPQEEISAGPMIN
jgi:hypothetical protein